MLELDMGAPFQSFLMLVLSDGLSVAFYALPNKTPVSLIWINAQVRTRIRVPKWAMGFLLRTVPSFCGRIPHIVRVSSKEKMFGVYAPTIVTAMQNIQSRIRIEPHEENCSDTMGIPRGPSEPNTPIS
jgi:hypothetical protein